MYSCCYSIASQSHQYCQRKVVLTLVINLVRYVPTYGLNCLPHPHPPPPHTHTTHTIIWRRYSSVYAVSNNVHHISSVTAHGTTSFTVFGRYIQCVVTCGTHLCRNPCRFTMQVSTSWCLLSGRMRAAVGCTRLLQQQRKVSSTANPTSVLHVYLYLLTCISVSVNLYYCTC